MINQHIGVDMFSYDPKMWAVYSKPRDGSRLWGLHSIHWRKIQAQEMAKIATYETQIAVVKKAVVNVSISNWSRK